MISSLTNETVKYLIKLQKPSFRKQEQKFIVEGPHLVEEAKKAGVLLETYGLDDLEGMIQVSDAVMKKISTTNSPVMMIGICKMSLKSEITNKVLILDRISDPGNMGTLLRSAKSFGFESIVIGEGSVDLFNEKVIRSTQGAMFSLNFIFADLFFFLKEIKKTHRLYGTDVRNGIDVRHVKPHSYVALLLGNEGSGVHPELLKQTHENLYISLHDMESLNVGVAGSILMYELDQ